jgi:hypothetical protein
MNSTNNPANIYLVFEESDNEFCMRQPRESKSSGKRYGSIS